MWRTNGHKKRRGNPGFAQTPSVRDLEGLPDTMVEQSWYGFALVLACFALIVSPVAAANKTIDSGNKHSIDRYNQLQLRAEQKTYQQSVEPLSPVDQRSLEMQLNQQRLQQRNLQLRHDQRLQAERQQHRINSIDPSRVNRPGQSAQRQQQQQRLQMRMQRKTWSYPRN